jgi:hypothetical protein
MYIPFRAATMFRAALPSTRARSQKKPVQRSESGEGAWKAKEPDQRWDSADRCSARSGFRLVMNAQDSAHHKIKGAEWRTRPADEIRNAQAGIILDRCRRDAAARRFETPRQFGNDRLITFFNMPGMVNTGDDLNTVPMCPSGKRA